VNQQWSSNELHAEMQTTLPQPIFPAENILFSKENISEFLSGDEATKLANTATLRPKVL
jgi:hypothetical protein